MGLSENRVPLQKNMVNHHYPYKRPSFLIKTYIRRPRLQQGERVRGEITSSKGQEARRKKSGSKCKQQGARSKKQEDEAA
jgi:hypothetical protein